MGGGHLPFVLYPDNAQNDRKYLTPEPSACSVLGASALPRYQFTAVCSGVY
jgi:hypothetical protein